MPGLQRAIDDSSRQVLRHPHWPSNVGGVGVIGFGVFGVPSTPPFSGGQLELPSFPQELTRPTRSAAVGYRTRELEWRRTHAGVLRGFANEWVALEGEQIVAHGHDPAQVVIEARAKGIKTPYIFYVESPGAEIAQIGL